MSADTNPRTCNRTEEERIQQILRDIRKDPIYKCPRCGLEQILLKEGARIRGLEADVAAYMKDVDDMARERNLYEERIAKAREILESYTPMPGKRSGFLSEIIKQTLDALEGK